MRLDPFRWWRRRQRLAREVHDEALFLQRRHGDEAVAVAKQKLQRTDLTRWGRHVLEGALRQLERGPGN